MGRLTVARSAIVAGALLCGLLAVWLAAAARDADRLHEANAAGAAGRYEQALREARAVERRPAATRALVAEARALASLGRVDQAAAAYERAVEREPNDWVLRVEAAGAQRVLGRDARALEHRRRAQELNPRVVVPEEYLAPGLPGAD